MSMLWMKLWTIQYSPPICSYLIVYRREGKQQQLCAVWVVTMILIFHQYCTINQTVWDLDKNLKNFQHIQDFSTPAHPLSFAVEKTELIIFCYRNNTLKHYKKHLNILSNSWFLRPSLFLWGLGSLKHSLSVVMWGTANNKPWAHLSFLQSRHSFFT